MEKNEIKPQRDTHAAQAERILDAALQMFAANGFAATSMDTIVDRAKVSKSTIYNHYPSKEALFAATVQRETRRIASEMTIAADTAALPIRDALERIARSYIKELLAPDRLNIYRMTIAESARCEELGHIFYENIAANPWHSFVEIVERARQCGELLVEDCDLATVQFLALVRGDLQLRALVGLPIEQDLIDYVCRQAVATFMARFGSQAECASP